MVTEETRAVSHVAPATQYSEPQRHVSTAEPAAFGDFRESAHTSRAQSTRYPLSPLRQKYVRGKQHGFNERSECNGWNSTSDDNRGDDNEAERRIYRTSFLPLPAFSLQQVRHECAQPSLFSRREFSGVVSTVNSLSSSHTYPLQLNDAFGNSYLSNNVFKRTYRIDFSIGHSAQSSGHAAMEAGATVYSQSPMPRGGPWYHEPSLLAFSLTRGDLMSLLLG